MSPYICSCVICGWDIYDDEDSDQTSWINQFRILYSCQDRVAITGVGIYDEPDGGLWMAPLDFTARWDSAPYSPTHIGVLEQEPVNGRYGFPFHEACWSLLEKAYSPETVPCRPLFEVCRSLPFPSRWTGLSWGHDFGGLAVMDNIGYPWEDHLTEQDIDSAICLIARNNPYSVPEIQQLLHEDPQLPADSRLVQKTADCFTILPPEILIEISLYLSTVDALNARQASGSFLFIYNTPKFWNSKFGANADRSWLFEASGLDRTCDWRWLYHRTNRAYRTGGMNNRERVWKLIQRIQGTLTRQWIGSLSSPNSAAFKWLEATGDLRPTTHTGPYHGFNEGCRLFREQLISIPPDQLIQMAFSIIQLGDARYIAGIRLILSGHQDIQLGYKTEEEHILDIMGLAGFNIAVGSRGIQGIRCVLNNGRESQWIGSPRNVPRTRRLALSNAITAIKVGFDGCKMVSLAVAGRTAEQGNSLRDLALWYPEIPEASMHLNDECFIARDISTTRYQPLFWTLFGGPGGVYLRSLVGISVSIFGWPVGIEFHYDNNNVPIECRQLGRNKTFRQTKVMRFPIDGPGGEIIESITLYLAGPKASRLHEQEKLQSFKILTSHGRFRHFGAKEAKGDVIEKPIMSNSGSTISGFYGSQDGNRITAIGIISQVIQESPGEHDRMRYEEDVGVT